MTERLPTPDYCWEGRLIVTLTLLVLLWIFTALRFKALQGISYGYFSPRGIAGACVVGIAAICTAYAGIVVWNYTVWYDLRGLHQLSWRTRDDAMLEVLRDGIPDEGQRKTISFWLRMMLVTVLWLVKFSFVLIFYDFKDQLPSRTRMCLYLTTGTLVTSYIVVWIATVADLTSAMEREKYSPAAGAGVALFTPLSRWSDFVPKKSLSGVSTLLVAEIIITSLNLFTDILLLITVYFIFQHLSLARGRGQFRAASLMTILFAITIIIAIIRLGILVGDMEKLYNRLAFDALTDVEAFIAGMGANMPAVRALVRSAELDKQVFGFMDSWSRKSKSRKSLVPPSGNSTTCTAKGESIWEGFNEEEVEEGKKRNDITIVELGSLEGISWEDMAQKGIR